jgi:hypothetical protein
VVGLLVIVAAFVLTGIYTAFADLRCRFAILPQQPKIAVAEVQHRAAHAG